MSALSLLRDPELVSFLLVLNMLPSLPPPLFFSTHIINAILDFCVKRLPSPTLNCCFFLSA